MGAERTTTGAARALLPSGWRGDRDPAFNLALEEAIFLRNDGLVLRVWENSESVIIGRAQLPAYETDLDYCREQGIPVLRRFTAGGAVYNGPGNINWSLFVGRDVSAGDLRYESSPRAIFAAASGPIISALGSSGVPARLDPPNSIATREGKVSGMAAYVSRRGFLCHGTLLVGADLARVKALTTPSQVALEKRYSRSRDVRTANLNLEVDSFIRMLIGTLADETGMKLAEGKPGEEEVRTAGDLLANKYGRDEWNLGDPFKAVEGSGR